MTISNTPKFSVQALQSLLAKHYNLSGQLKKLPGYCDQNLLLTTTDNQQFIVKVANAAEPKLELEMQNAAMQHLTKKRCAVPQALNNKDGESISKIVNEHQQSFCLRVLSFIVGNFYAEAESINHTPQKCSLNYSLCNQDCS